MLRKLPLLFKLAAAALLLIIAALAAATAALKIYLPPEKVRGLIVENARKTLKREVRLQGVSLGVLKGLSLDGLEISEHPDFKAGKFAGVESFQLRIQLLPLLRKKFVVDRIAASGLEVNVAKAGNGRFNFDDLLAAQEAPKKKTAEPPLPLVLRVDRASLSRGRIDYRDDAAGEHMRLSGLEAEATNFSVDPAAMRLSATIEKLAADVSGLALSVSGRIKVDKERLDVPDLKGRLGEGALSAALAVRNYAKAPDVDLEASLSRLDLGKLMAVKQAMEASGQAPAKKALSRPSAPAAAGAAPAMKAKGKVSIGEMLYAGAVANDADFTWELSGITPDLRGVGGWAKLHVAEGKFESEQKEAGRSGLMKALLIPFTILKTVGRLLAPLRLLPDFSHFAFREVAGDYVFQQGVMTVRDFRMDSAAAQVKTTGTIELPAQKLNLLVEVFAAKLAPIEIDVGGTFENPSVRPRLTKALAAPVSKLTDKAGSLFKSLFKK